MTDKNPSKKTELIIVITIIAILILTLIYYSVLNPVDGSKAAGHRDAGIDTTALITEWRSAQLELMGFFDRSQLVDTVIFNRKFDDNPIDDNGKVVLDSSIIDQVNEGLAFIDSSHRFLLTELEKHPNLKARRSAELAFVISGHEERGSVFRTGGFWNRNLLLTSVAKEIREDRDFRKFAHPAWKDLSFYESETSVMKKLKQDSEIFVDGKGFYATMIGPYFYNIDPRFYDDKLYELLFFSKTYQMSEFDTHMRNDFMNFYRIISKKYGEVYTLKTAWWDIDTGKKITKSKWTKGKKKIELAIQSGAPQQYTIVLSMFDVDLSKLVDAEEQKSRQTSQQRVASDF